MKKSFMTRVLAVSLSAAMAFSMSSASNLVTASAASTVNLKTTFKTLKVGQTYKLTLKKNTLNWKITKVTTTNKKICTVYGKTASSVMLKGKGVGRAKISVKVKTTKRKYPKNIKIMKCTANVKAATDNGGTTEEFKATAAANSNTEVRVSFNKEIDAPEPANFTVSDGVTVGKAELSEDKKSVVLTIGGAEHGKTYDLTVSGIKVAGKEQAEQKLTFTVPAAEEKYPLTLKANDEILKSDGQSQTIVTFTIKDANGNVVHDKGVEVAFATSLGKFAEQRVAVQDGVATVMYTSEVLMDTQQAKITATIVESTENKELLGLNTSTSITLTPNPESLEDTSVGAIITSATAPTADRVIAYFNQKVKAADFKTESGKIDFSKFSCKVESGLDNGFVTVPGVSKEHKVVGILDVDSDENALQLLIDRPMIDNTNVKVDFENKTKANSLVSAKNTVYFKLTDARQPAFLSAAGSGLREITVNFSEAVLPTSYCDSATENKFAGDNPENYLIDGVPLTQLGVTANDIKAPSEEQADSTDGSLATISEKDDSQKGNQARAGEIQIGSYSKDGDNRHVVKIKLGRDFYLTPGKHRISVSNVGDWAAKTDRERNIVNTEGFDFDVEGNDAAPSFTVTEQSPEQWLVSFNSDVEPVSSNEYLRTRNSSQIQSLLKLQQRDSSGWTDISTSSESDKNPIRVSQVKDTNNYIVEVTKDWTQVYNTASTRSNYFNHDLRLHIDADKIVNLANDKKNPELNVDLNGTIMKSPDVQSPEITEVVPALDKAGNVLDSWNVTLSEPVKLSQDANLEGLTPSQEQETAMNPNNAETMGIPAPSAEFIRVDNTQTINGVITSRQFVDAEDRTINVAPETTLSPGEWRLVVSSISDDYGRTTATATHNITVVGDSVKTGFKVVWAAVGDKLDYTEANFNGRGRYIYVKFNKPVTMTGNSVNAQVTGNYTINGSTLPTGTDIRAHIQGYDSHIRNVTDSITIVLPEGNVNNGSHEFTVDAQNTMLNISRAITATTGENLENGGLIRIPFQYGLAPSTNGGVDTVNTPIIGSLQTESDAVWGNDAKEQLSNYKIKKEYYRDLKAALENDKYRKVILTDDLNLTATNDDDGIQSVFGRSGTLTLNRAVDFDLNGFDINGNVVVSTSDIVNSMRIYNGKGNDASEITGKSTNKENTATLTVDAGRIKDFSIESVTVNAAGEGCAVQLKDVYVDTFTNKGTINGDILVTDNKDGFGFDNDSVLGTLTNCILIIDSNGEINLKGNLTTLNGDDGIGIMVNQAAKVVFAKNSDISGVNVSVSGKRARLILKDATVNTNTTVIAKAKDVRVELGTLADVQLKTGPNGEIVAVNANNDKLNEQPKVEDSNILATFKTINVVNGDISAFTKENEQHVISASALVSGASFDTNAIAKEIAKITINETGTSDTNITAYPVKATYFLVSTNILESKGNGMIGKKQKPSEDKSVYDIIRVTLTCNNQQFIREIKVTNN